MQNSGLAQLPLGAVAVVGPWLADRTAGLARGHPLGHLVGRVVRPVVRAAHDGAAGGYRYSTCRTFRVRISPASRASLTLAAAVVYELDPWMARAQRHCGSPGLARTNSAALRAPALTSCTGAGSPEDRHDDVGDVLVAQAQLAVLGRGDRHGLLPCAAPVPGPGAGSVPGHQPVA